MPCQQFLQGKLFAPAAFWRGAGKEGMRQKRCQPFFIDCPLRCPIAVCVIALAEFLLAKGVHCHVAGSNVVRLAMFLAAARANVGNVGNAANVDDVARRALRKKLQVEKRRKRRALAAKGDVLRAKVANHIAPAFLRQQSAVEQLPSRALLRAVGYCLSVAANGRVARRLLRQLRAGAGANFANLILRLQ